MKFEEMDATAPLAKQLEDPYGGSIVLINKFTVALEDRDALIAAWANDAAYFKQQPGFISAQLHRGIGDSPVFLNYAVWESVEAFRQRSDIRNSGVGWRSTQAVWWHRPTCSRRLRYRASASPDSPVCRLSTTIRSAGCACRCGS